MGKAVFDHAPEILAAAAQSDRAFAALIILVLGAIAGSMVAKGDKPGLKITIFTFTAVVAIGLFAWSVESEAQTVLKATTEKIDRLAAALRNEIDNRNLSDAARDIEALSALAPSSGHTLYFEGEVNRIGAPTRDIYKAIDWFGRYLDDPRSTAMLSSERMDAQFCYESPAGFCRQRTGWIAHLLANMFYQLSSEEADSARRISYLDRARQSLDLSVKHYPKKFSATVAAPDQLVDNRWSTDDLMIRVGEALAQKNK